MKVLVTTVASPFHNGGAEALAASLLTALRDAGHEADLASIFFEHGPPDRLERSIDFWLDREMDLIDGQTVDHLICLK
ncbi:MAG: glycosyltransferase family 1 protein, partial [Acidobacteriota bacterium]